MRVVLATSNTHKVNELQALLPTLSLVGQDTFNIESAAETGLTFIENALIKARHAAASAGLPALADDSGLVVPALEGAPGIISARYAGEDATDTDNNQKLLQALDKIARRDAFFFCCLVLISHAEDPTPLIATGRWHGDIIRQPKGRHGFGYDPLFRVQGLDCTAAELTQEEKGQRSHRGLAARELHRMVSSQR